MRPDIPTAARRLALATCLAPVLLLAACGTQPPERIPDSTGPAPLPDGGTPLTPLPASDESPLADLFVPAMAALDRGDWMAAQLALPTPADDTAPSPEFQAYAALVAARTADLRGDLAALQEALAGAPWAAASQDLRRQRLALERRGARLRGNHLESARLADRALPLYPAADPARDALARSLWRDLHYLDERELADARRGATPSLRGWLARLAVARGEGTEADWRSRYPDHPAAALPLPATDLVQLDLAAVDAAGSGTPAGSYHASIRPSGTEPKLKIYLEYLGPAGQALDGPERSDATARLDTLGERLRVHLG